MSKLFVSYRRKSWPFTHHLAEELNKRLDAEIFVDFTGVDEDDFERSILRNLRDSDAVLLVISEHTFADRIHRDGDWVRREIREALTHDIPIVLVCVDGLLPRAGLPDDIKDIARKQGINFYPDYFAAAVDKLAGFVVTIGAAHYRDTAAPLPVTMPLPGMSEKEMEKSISGRETLNEALALLDEHDYGKAIFLLEALKEQGFKSHVIQIDDLLENARRYQAEAERIRRAKMEYEEIILLAERHFTEAQAHVAWDTWCQDYPDLVAEIDRQNLRNRFAPPKPARKEKDKETPTSLELTAHRAKEAADSMSSLELVTRRAKEAADSIRSAKEEANFIASDPAPKLKLAPPPAKPKSARSKIYDILPAPFDLIKIPAGKVIIEGKTETIEAFQVAKYPATNAEFAKFLGAGGYQQKKWWTDAGWQQKEKKGWDAPHSWLDAQWNDADQPVVGMSWYEAVAFCLWLSEAASEDIMLPSEQQWQRAAQGDDGRIYPWGNDWDCKRCNNSVEPCSSSVTTPVTQYEGEGESPFSVVDMAGNVWEWCRTAYKTGLQDINGTDVRVLRGGSWDILISVLFRVDFRSKHDPDDRDLNRGFRFSLSG